MASNTEDISTVEQIPRSEGSLVPWAIPPRRGSSTALRIVELALVMGVAFATSIILSFSNVQTEFPVNNQGFVYGIGSQLISLVFLAYILFRQRRTFGELGVGFSLSDVPVSVALCLVSLLLSRWFYLILAYSYRLVNGIAYHPKALGGALFGIGVTVTGLVYSIVNPFKEELIARAYLMTEIEFLSKSVWLAILVSVLFQTSYHFYQGVIPALSHIPTFTIFALYFAMQRRITPVILAHLYMDVLAWTNHALS